MQASEHPVLHGSTLIPGLRYRDAYAAIDWLVDVLGFARHAVFPGPDNTVDHAELVLGDGMVMLGSVRESPLSQYSLTPAEAGMRVTSGVYVVVPDCNPVWERARAARADITMELQTMPYGGQAFALRDPEGYLWSLGEYDPWRPAPSADPTGDASNNA